MLSRIVGGCGAAARDEGAGGGGPLGEVEGEAGVEQARDQTRPIVWKGEWKGKPYEDKGVILNVDPGHTLRYSHWSPLSGQPDTPENRHTVTIELAGEGGRTQVSLAQDNNKTAEEQASSAKNWTTMLEGLKKAVEKS
jgi:uncharacterized protein YndB with AHSA1/START domain